MTSVAVETGNAIIKLHVLAGACNDFRRPTQCFCAGRVPRIGEELLFERNFFNFLHDEFLFGLTGEAAVRREKKKAQRPRSDQ